MRKILYNTCMNKLSGMSIVMDIEDLAGFNLKLDKTANRCAVRLSGNGGGLKSANCKLFAIFSFNTRNAPCAKVYKLNKGGLMNRIIVQYRLLRRIV